MGELNLQGMLDHSDDIRTVLSWHLTSNHFPPVPTAMIEPCVLAIEYCDAGDPDRIILLPNPITWKGKGHAPAWAIVEGHHLESFLSLDDE